ncbi:MAG: hypothetical protein GX184_07595 [Clostridiaceae bacterium]|nr:hypothetical protein [Clostridiaceae bacterium]
MNKLNELFKKDSVIKIISVLIAVFIWFLVLEIENPYEERTLSIPLQNNIEMLRVNNLQITGNQLPTTVDVKIKGRRYNVSSVSVNDFRAFIDLSEITTAGSSVIKIDIPEYTGKEDILITSINPSSVKLDFERIVGKQYPVNVEFKGKLPAGYELVNLTVDPGNMILEELESSISRVDKVVAYINLDEIGDNTEIIMRGTAIDTNGEIVKQFEGKIPVIVRFNLAKQLPVAATTRGVPESDYYLKEVRFTPSKIRVLGPRKILDGLNVIEAEPIDITGLSSNFNTPVTLKLPEGVTVLKEDLEKLTAEVVIENLAIRRINIPASQISIFGSDMSGNKVYRVSDRPVLIAIKGRPDIINAVKTTDISASIQVSGFEEGEHEVPLTLKVPDNVILIGEYTVNVIIEKDTGATSP